MIPERFRGTCKFCGGELNTNGPGVYQLTTGWALKRKGGGTHALSLPEPQDVWAHPICIEREQKGHSRQTRMFG